MNGAQNFVRQCSLARASGQGPDKAQERNQPSQLLGEMQMQMPDDDSFEPNQAEPSPHLPGPLNGSPGGRRPSSWPSPCLPAPACSSSTDNNGNGGVIYHVCPGCLMMAGPRIRVMSYPHFAQ
uniref:HDC07172 n=1 Tax=Drosophila melanogaster TaxID=7227 RepID=Q6IG55_DROME|nr:TPA_inf: HDC07172 [Drosophila melanogaster]